MKIAASLLAVVLMAFAPVMTAWAAFADKKGCPRGLVKKNPNCGPPGQAKKGVTTKKWLNRDRTGDVVNRSDLIFLDDFALYDCRSCPTDSATRSSMTGWW